MTNSWINRIFLSKQAKSGGVVRRSIFWVNYHASIFELRREVEFRGFHMVISGDQAIIFCHQGDLAIAC
jgi:hypothetical protein